LKHDPTASQFITRSTSENGVPKHLISVNLREASIAQAENGLPGKK
jgi:hypothetical protein